MGENVLSTRVGVWFMSVQVDKILHLCHRRLSSPYSHLPTDKWHSKSKILYKSGIVRSEVGFESIKLIENFPFLLYAIHNDVVIGIGDDLAFGLVCC